MNPLTLPAILAGLFIGFFSDALSHPPPLLLLACGSWVVALGYCFRPKPSLPLWVFAALGALAVALHITLAVIRLLPGQLAHNGM